MSNYKCSMCDYTSDREKHVIRHYSAKYSKCINLRVYFVSLKNSYSKRSITINTSLQ